MEIGSGPGAQGLNCWRRRRRGVAQFFEPVKCRVPSDSGAAHVAQCVKAMNDYRRSSRISWMVATIPFRLAAATAQFHMAIQRYPRDCFISPIQMVCQSLSRVVRYSRESGNSSGSTPIISGVSNDGRSCQACSISIAAARRPPPDHEAAARLLPLIGVVALAYALVAPGELAQPEPRRRFAGRSARRRRNRSRTGGLPGQQHHLRAKAGCVVVDPMIRVSVLRHFRIVATSCRRFQHPRNCQPEVRHSRAVNAARSSPGDAVGNPAL